MPRPHRPECRRRAIESARERPIARIAVLHRHQRELSVCVTGCPSLTSTRTTGWA